MATRTKAADADQDTETVDDAVIAIPEQGRVFTNTRFPEAKMLTPDGVWVKFNSTKALVKDSTTAEFLAGVRGVFIEPEEFMSLKRDDKKFFVHKATGFKTLSKDAYNDWINRSEWSATAPR